MKKRWCYTPLLTVVFAGAGLAVFTVLWASSLIWLIFFGRKPDGEYARWETDYGRHFLFLVVGYVLLVCIVLFSGRGRPWAARIISRLSIVSAAVLVVLCSVGIITSLRRTPIDDYFMHLQRADVTIPPPGEKYTYQESGPLTTYNWPNPSYETRTGYREGVHGLRTTTVGEVKVFQLCAKEGCRLIFGASDAVPPDHSAFDSTALLQRWSEAVQIVLDPKKEFLFFSPGWEEFHLESGYWKRVPFSAKRIAARTSAPNAYFWVSVPGLVLVGFLLLLRRRLAADERRLQNARAAVLGWDGEITFDDGTTGRIAGKVPFFGPIAVVAPTKGSAYRSKLELLPADVRSGKVEDLLAQAHLNLAKYDAAVVATAWFGAAPMVAAAMIGLLI
ncbi:MAG: hypothetical protein IPK82_43970 [Polyangiaceae bacterium]|nr:hypothetical protein [Polyangiaceae bacterium]